MAQTKAQQGARFATHRDSIPFKTADVHTPAANTAAIVTYAAEQNKYHVISGIAWSYNDDPTGGNLKIDDGDNHTFFEVDITVGGPGFIPFDPEMHGAKGQPVIVTLAAAGAAVTGKVNVLGHRTVE